MTQTPGLTAPPRRCRFPDGTGTGDHPAAGRRRAGRARTQQQDQHELIILNIPAARSCLTLTGDGYSQWHYEPGTGPATDAATLTAIITHILKAPHAAGTTPPRTPTGRSRSKGSWDGACKTGA